MVGNLDYKVRELNIIFEDCIKNYQDPQRFLTYLHSLLQALRNFTWAIQSNKKAIPDFDNWYGYWQNKCKADPILNWLGKVRIEVVHEDILAASSSALIKFYENYNEPVKVVVMGHMTPTDEMRARTNILIEKMPSLRFGNIELERSYRVTANGKDYEVVDVLKHCKKFMETIYRDLRNYLNNQNSKHLKPSRFVENSSREYASVRFLISDGEMAEYGSVKTKLDKPFLKIVKERYRGHPPLSFREPNDKKFIKQLHSYAEYVFKTDGNHQPLLVTKVKGQWSPSGGVVFKNRSEKILFWHSLARRAKEEKIEAIVFIAEQWVHLDPNKYNETYSSGGDTEKLPNKLEALSTYYASSKGGVEHIQSMIIRDKKGNPRLTKAENIKSSPHDAGFLYPVFKVWGVNVDPKTKKTLATQF
jgi:hypothetical protein